VSRPDPSPTAEVPPPAVSGLVRAGTFDAELAALVWLTVDAGIPVIVAGGNDPERREVRDALLGLLPAGRPTVVLGGAAESFAWMADREVLGWGSVGGTAEGAAPGPEPPVMVADLVPGDGGTWGDAARLAIRALTTGHGLVATAEGSSLEEVLARLAAAPVGAIDDEMTRLGVVLVLGSEPGEERRVVAAHYLRPVARDPSGHVQRLPPAVLATWNPRTARFDHFAWGVLDELAGRTGRRPLDFEREQARRASAIAAAARS
jgi:hypothetical protein